MNKRLHIAFLAAAMAATCTLAAAKPSAPPPAPQQPPAPAPAPVPQFIGNDIGTFSFSGTADNGEFYVTLDAGTYVITGDIKTTADSSKNYNLTGATLTSGSLSDPFEHQGADHYFENPYILTVTSPTELLLNVNTNNKSNGGYDGTVTIAAVPLATDVPEPASALLLLAGVGMLGFSARRRRI